MIIYVLVMWAAGLSLQEANSSHGIAFASYKDCQVVGLALDKRYAKQVAWVCVATDVED